MNERPRSGFRRFSCFPAWVVGLACALALGMVTPAAAQDPAATPDRVKLTRLQGSAFHDRNSPVIGATVVATPEDKSPRVFVTATDRRGAFKIDGMPEGDYRVEIRREGMQPVAKDNVVLKFPFRAVVEVQMSPSDAAQPASSAPGGEAARDGAGSLRATIVDREGHPVSEVDVRLAPVGGGADPRFPRTDATGTIEVAGLSAGPWTIEARALGYLPLRADFEVDGPVEMKLVVVPQPGDYEPSPLDLLPPEEPIPPPVLTGKAAG